MTAIDSSLVLLMAEALAALIILAVALFALSRSKHNKEIKEIDRFITVIDEQEIAKNQPLEQLLSESCGFDRERIDTTLQEITQSERALLQRIIQLFLQRDLTLLDEINQGIGDLSEPYCRLLASAAASAGKTNTGAAGAGSDTNAAGLERVNQQLIRQLDTAMPTIDEITAEYTRVFSGNQSALELENSSKKMLQIFQEAEHNINQQLRQ
jgi:hypothetical protein